MEILTNLMWSKDLLPLSESFSRKVPPNHFVSHMNIAQSLTPIYFKIRFNIIQPYFAY